MNSARFNLAHSARLQSIVLALVSVASSAQAGGTEAGNANLIQNAAMLFGNQTSNATTNLYRLPRVPHPSTASYAAPPEPTEDEAYYMSHYDPFVNIVVAPIDPITRQRVKDVITGPAFKSDVPDYDYYRMVTFYNVEETYERAPGVPTVRENCFNNFGLFASWSFSTTWTSNATLSWSPKALGVTVGGSISYADTKTFTQNIQAVGGVVADHTLMYMKESWYGRTYIQTYNSKTKQFAIITKKKVETPRTYTHLFPIAPKLAALSAPKPRVVYPAPFRIIDQKWTLKDKREIVPGQDCNMGLGLPDAPSAPVMVRTQP